MKNFENNTSRSFLATLGSKLLHNFDLAFSGLCLILALVSRPFMVSFYEQPLADANAHYEQLYNKSNEMFSAANGYKATNADVLRNHLDERKDESAEMRQLSEDFQRARADVRRKESSLNFASGYGHVNAAVFFGMGAFSAYSAITTRRREKKGGVSPN